MATAYVTRNKLNWPLLIDKNQDLYRAYGFQRAGWWTLMNPKSIFGYLKLMMRGTLPGTPGRDVNQLGGDVIIDPSGNIRLHHISSNPHDRPDIAAIVDLVLQRK